MLLFHNEMILAFSLFTGAVVNVDVSYKKKKKKRKEKKKKRKNKQGGSRTTSLACFCDHILLQSL